MTGNVQSIGAALRVPEGVKSRTMPVTASQKITRLLGYSNLTFAPVVERGLRSTAPLSLVDRIGGVEMTPVNNTPSIDYNADGNGRWALSFASGVNDWITGYYELPETYSFFDVVKPALNASGLACPIMAHEDSSGAAMMYWLNQDDDGGTYDMHCRHGTGGTQVQAMDMVQANVRQVVGVTYNPWTARSSLHHNLTTIHVDTLTPQHPGADKAKVSVGGSSTHQFQGLIVAFFVFDTALYHPVADYSENEYRQQFLSDVIEAYGI